MLLWLKALYNRGFIRETLERDETQAFVRETDEHIVLLWIPSHIFNQHAFGVLAWLIDLCRFITIFMNVHNEGLLIAQLKKDYMAAL